MKKEMYQNLRGVPFLLQGLFFFFLIKSYCENPIYKPNMKQCTIFTCSLKLSLFANEAVGVQLESQ